MRKRRGEKPVSTPYDPTAAEENRKRREYLTGLCGTPDAYPGEWVLILAEGSPWERENVTVLDHDADHDALAKRFWSVGHEKDSGHHFLINPERNSFGLRPNCPNDGLCKCCRKRKATIQWVGDGGVMAWAHGMAEGWCEICATEAQVEYARDAAQRLPELEARLAELREAENAAG